MHRHPHFDLWLHDDTELSAALGSTVTGRETIHEWPLSSVQRVRTADGARRIYKVQAPPTLEPAFYARARSPLLVATRVLPSQGTTAAMVMDEVDALRLTDLRPAEPEAADIAAALTRQIAEIQGDLPTMFDISTEARWAEYFGSALDDMRACVAEGSFQKVDLDLVRDLGRLAESASVLDTIRSPSGFVHADLMADNVLVTSDGYRVLDWQRPIRGPVALDTATLLISLGVDATRHVPLGAVQLHHLLHTAWYAQSARRWLPGAKPFLDGFIARIGGELQKPQ